MMNFRNKLAAGAAALTLSGLALAQTPAQPVDVLSAVQTNFTGTILPAVTALFIAILVPMVGFSLVKKGVGKAT